MRVRIIGLKKFIAKMRSIDALIREVVEQEARKQAGIPMRRARIRGRRR